MAMGLFLRLFFCFVLLSGVVDVVRLISMEWRKDLLFWDLSTLFVLVADAWLIGIEGRADLLFLSV